MKFKPGDIVIENYVDAENISHVWRVLKQEFENGTVCVRPVFCDNVNFDKYMTCFAFRLITLTELCAVRAKIDIMINDLIKENYT